MSRRARLGFGIGDVAFAIFLFALVFKALPTRYWVVDGGATIAGALMAIAGAALVADHKHAKVVARVASMVTLGLGMLLVAALAFTAAWLSGTYGPVGKGGAAIFVLVLFLVVPYAIVFPAVELAWLGPREGKPRTE